MILFADILEGWKRLWDGAGMREFVPGGLHFGRVNPEVKAPYASVSVTEGEVTWTSEKDFLQVWQVMVRVWSDGGVIDAGKIERALRETFHRDRQSLLALYRGCQTVDLRPIPGKLDQEQPTRNALDVTLLGLTWELLLQGTKRT